MDKLNYFINIKIGFNKFLFFTNLIFFFFTLILSFHLFFVDKALPTVSVLGMNVGGLNKNEITKLLIKRFSPPDKIILIDEEKKQPLEIILKDLDFSYNFEKTAKIAVFTNKSKNPLKNVFNIFSFPFKKTNIPLSINLDEKKLDEYLQIIKESTQTKVSYPKVSYEAGNLIVTKGSPGRELDSKKIKMAILDILSNSKEPVVKLKFTTINPQISEERAKELGKKAEKLLNKSVTLFFESSEIVYGTEYLVSFIDKDASFSEEKIKNFIKNEVSPKFNKEPQNAFFKFLGDEGEGKIVEFKPAKEGLMVDEKLLAEKILNSLRQLEENNKEAKIEIPIEKIPPEITTEMVNNMGIKELLGKGVSKFKGSSSERLHNIKLASSKFNGVLVKPNEVFSFNEILGDVSSYTGYKQGYIIKDGKTVLGDGGGVCQVSTTLFRALLSAGLPIIERRAHSYRVRYYEQDSLPGLDATVFAPTTDLKFKNDTGNYLLIQSDVDLKNYTLTFEIYGTFDGRNITLTKPVISSSTPPPDDLYIDDPNLPAGVVKQIEYKAWGTKVSFFYRVEKNEEILYENTFVSNYRPWQAVFLRGVGEKK